jgi:MoaA/NifB/PqqE/SkfB family radical SAM enzyme
LNRHLCMLPWVQATVFVDGGTSPCCHNWVSMGSLSLRNAAIEEARNSPEIREIRRMMMRGEASRHCSYCYQIEALGSPSPRTLANRRFVNELAWVDRTSPDGSVVTPLRALHFRLSNVCNLRCRTCDADCSTSWYGDAKALGDPTPAGPLRPLDSIRSLREQILSVLPGIKFIYFGGGEPLLEEAHYAILDALLELGKEDVVFEYNTNLTALTFGKRDILALWRRFRSVCVGVSVDGAGAQFEYLRKGGEWSRILENHRRLREEAPDALFYIHCTLSVLNVFHLADAVQEWLRCGLLRWPDELVSNYLRRPEYLEMAILNEAERRRLAARYERSVAELPSSTHLAVGKSIERMFRCVLGWLENQPFTPERARLREQFRDRTRSLDRLRGESTEELFSDLTTLMEEVK